MLERSLSSSSSSSSFERDSDKSFLYSILDFALTSFALVLNLYWRNFAIRGSIVGGACKEYLASHSITLILDAFSVLNSAHHFVLNFLLREGGRGGFWTKVYSHVRIQERMN